MAFGQEKAKKQRVKLKRKEQPPRRRRAPTSPLGDSSGDQAQDAAQKKPQSPTNPSRRRSEAEKRSEIERQRRRQHDAAERDAHANNRFLRALSGQIAIPDEEEKEKQGASDDDDTEDVGTATSLLSRRDTAVRTKSTEGIVVAPAAPYSNWFSRRQTPLPAAKRWTEQLQQLEAAGLFVDEERKQFGQLEHSTLDRLEDRLNRELFTRSQPQKEIKDTTTMQRKNTRSRELLIEELLRSDSHESTLSSTESAAAVEDGANDASCWMPVTNTRNSDAKENQQPSLAMLELFVDRVVLDDHPTYTLADRLAAQLRELYRAYIRMQQLQPWQLALQRLDEFFSHHTNKLAEASNRMSMRTDLSTRQVIQELDQLLTDLEALSQLHRQILGKADEMRDAATRAGSTLPLRVRQRHRMQPIDLARVDAVVEILKASIDNQQDESEQHGDDKLPISATRLTERLSTISTASAHALQTALQLESVEGHGPPSDTFWSPRFYVVVRVNGKIACTTKMQPWSRGEVRFLERLCFTLPFFPSSVCAEVYERRRLLRDELLSTNSVPVIVPGQHVAKHAPSRSRSSLFDGWGDSNADHLVAAASVTPSDEWYQFSRTTPISRTQWHRSFYNAPLFANATRRTQGRVHVKASWIPNTASTHSQLAYSGDDTAYLPPKRPGIAGGRQASPSLVQLVGKSTRRESTRLSQYLCDSGFSSERDFLRLIEPQELLLDPNDPDTVSVRRLQEYYLQQQEEANSVGLGRRKVFRMSDVPGPLSGSGRGLTKRNRLLRLRDREYASRHGTSFCEAVASRDSGKVEPPRWIPQHAVFDEPLPILEHELLADERLLRLLRPELHAFDRRLLAEEAERADASIVERHCVRQLLKLQDFRERIRQSQIVSSYNTDTSNQEARSGRSKPLAAIVQEKPLPLFPGTLELPALGALFAPRRRLRPRAKAPTTAPSSQAAAHWPTACTLYVQVQKATNVPVRIKPPRNTAEAEELVATGRKRRDTLHRTKKSPRKMPMAEVENQSEEAVETPRRGLALEYESHVFVQVTFQGKTRHTSCSTVMDTTGKDDHDGGAHPTWMETVAFPFRPPQDDWSPEGLESSQDVVRLSLFDQVTRPASTATIDEDRQEGEERLGAQTRALHRENCFLGSLEVPFLTLYKAGRLEGSFRCEMPLEHLGYANLQIGAGRATSSTATSSTGPPSAASSDGEAVSPRQRRTRGLSSSSPARKRASLGSSSPRSPEASRFEDNDDDDGDTERLGVKQATREATFLKLTLLLDPVLPVANQAPDQDEKETWNARATNAQDKVLLAQAQRWVAGVRSSTAARRRSYNVFARNLSHGATFLPRFLRAQAPPVELQPASLPALVRYVSLLPFLNDWLAFDGDKDVWSTSQEFLNMGAGDHEEHAVLLANYFMWYDRRNLRKSEEPKPSRSYLVLGHAVPEGNIVYVLRRGVLWNASTGVGYAVSDPRCPLRDVSLVVSSKNVFANVQPLAFASGTPVGGSQDLNWAIESNPKCWKPFFTAKNLSLPPSVQRRELTYSETPAAFVEQVERELREALKLAVRRWRSAHFATNFNEAAGLQLREHLTVLEREASGHSSSQSTPSAVDHDARSSKRLKHKLKTKLALPTRRAHPGSAVLRELQRSREVCGLPLHVSFTDIPRVLELIENTVRWRLMWL
jgi:hypothetical protein